MKAFSDENPGRGRAESYAAGNEHPIVTRFEEISANWISAIRNLVCPECGGRMGGRMKEFQCQGQCGTDWRDLWESSFARYGPAD